MKKALRFFYNLIPLHLKNKIDQDLKQLKNCNILIKTYGQFKSMRECSCLDLAGKPIPWYTYPAIEYLNHLDFSQMNVFEFGGGNSTLWWAGKTKSVVSVEDDENWYNKVSSAAGFLPDKIRYILEKNKENYINAMPGNFFDIVIIDGKHRPECAKYVLNCYKNGGG